MPDADETTVCMVVGGWFAAGATHHFDAGVPNTSISFVDCRQAPLGGLVLRSPLNETSPSGSSYLVGPRESHLDLHHLLWSLLSWIAVMTVTCYGKKSSTPCASRERVRRQQIGAIYFRQSSGDSAWGARDVPLQAQCPAVWAMSASTAAAVDTVTDARSVASRSLTRMLDDVGPSSHCP